ncbi:hypothetical protein ASG06_17650 [Rathayibacter sp. Leaf185]|nr:hypothetical protein ASF42_18860 [Rathayibacter sp. Leaf294]KQS08563.1 hypothetical protein ASG06_17650 [Rathayibacter sp. Leaf185]
MGLVVDVLDYAFYGIDGSQPSIDRFQDLVRRGMLRQEQRIALKKGEIYFAQHGGVEIVLNVGERGTLRSVMKQAVSVGPLVLIILVLGGAIHAFATWLGLPFWAADLVLLVVLGGPILLVARMTRVPKNQREKLPDGQEMSEERRARQEKRTRELAETPNYFQGRYRRGVPRPYWIVSAFGARPSGLPAGATRTTGSGAGIVAVGYVRLELPKLLGPNQAVVGVARNGRLRRVYSWLEFKPLGKSKWVLIRRT